MESWLTMGVPAAMFISVALAIMVGVAASLLTGSGEPLPPALQLARTEVRVMLALAVAPAPGILFWLVVVGIVLIARRLWRSTELAAVNYVPSPSRSRIR